MEEGCKLGALQGTGCDHGDCEALQGGDMALMAGRPRGPRCAQFNCALGL